MAYSGRTYNTQRFINGNGFSSPTNHVMPLPKDPLEGVVKDEKARIARINPEQPPVGYKNLNTFARSPQSFRSPKTFTHSQRTVSPRSFTQSQRTVSPGSFAQSQRTISPSRTFGRTNGTIVKSPKINTFSSPQRSGRNLNTMTFNGNRTF